MPPGTAVNAAFAELAVALASTSTMPAAVAPLNMPTSPSGCSWFCPDDGPTIMGNFIFTPSSSDDRSTCDSGMGARVGTISTQSKAWRFRRKVNSDPSPWAVYS